MEVHGTVHGTSTVHLPSYVKNHGILSGRDLQFLLRETKVSPPPPLPAGSGVSRLEMYQCTRTRGNAFIPHKVEQHKKRSELEKNLELCKKK